MDICFNRRRKLVNVENTGFSIFYQKKLENSENSSGRNISGFIELPSAVAM